MIEVKDDTFEDVVKGNEKVVIVFSAPWCGPCRSMDPIWRFLSEKYEDVVFGKVDVDSDKEMASRYMVTGVPTIITFKEGEQKHRQVGAVGKVTLQNMIDEL